MRASIRLPPWAHPRFYFKNIDGETIDAFQVRCTVIPNTTDTVRGTDLLSMQALLRAHGGLVVQFQLREPAPVSLRLVDVRGRLVHEAFQNVPYSAGSHRWEWSGAGLASGVYLLELQTRHTERTARTVVLR